MTNFDDLKFAVESMGGGNTAILDDQGLPSIVVAVPKLKYADIMAGGTQDTLPAFIVDGEEKDVIYVSKFINVVINSRAYSLANRDPAAYVTFDQANTYAKNKGAGFHLMTNALWGALSAWCYKNQTVPRGNDNYGKSISASWEKGKPSMMDGANPGRTATGSGPVTWYHNYDKSGIADLVGNVWEWCGGMRLVNGEIQIIANGNAMKADCNQGATSTEWKAILQDGSLAEPGTAATLKYDKESASGGVRINTSVEFPTAGTTSATKTFGSVAPKSGVTVPNMLKALGLAPIADYTYGNGTLYMLNHEAERLPSRGGFWLSATNAGLPALALNSPRTTSSYTIGFRSAFFGAL